MEGQALDDLHLINVPSPQWWEGCRDVGCRGKLPFPEFYSILQVPLRHQKYSFPGVSRDLEHGCPIYSVYSLGRGLGPGTFERAYGNPPLGVALPNSASPSHLSASGLLV